MRVFHGLLAIVAMVGSFYCAWQFVDSDWRNWQMGINSLALAAAADVLIARARGKWPV